MNLLPDYPDDANCWVYAADRRLTPQQQTALLTALEPFLAEWTSHQQMVSGSGTILHDRFLVLVAVMQAGELSGCGIDKAVHRIEEAGALAGVGWLPSLSVLYRGDDGAVQHADRSEFRKAVESGTVRAETPVFDLGVTQLGALRNGGFERSAAESWHGRVFRIPALRSV